MGALVGGSWGVASFVVGWGERTGRWHFGCGGAVVAATAFAANCTAIVVWLRRRAPMNAIQRRFTTVITLCAWGMINHWGLCFALDVSPQVALALYLLWTSGGWLMAAIFYDRRVFGGALALALGALAVALAPGVRFEALGVTVFCTYGAVLFPPRWLDAEAILARIEGRDTPTGSPRGARD